MSSVCVCVCEGRETPLEQILEGTLREGEVGTMSVDRGPSEKLGGHQRQMWDQQTVLKSALNNVNARQMDAAKYTFIRQQLKSLS